MRISDWSSDVCSSDLLEDEDGYVLVAVPASCHVQLGKVARLLKHPVGLASETEAAELFADCARGALPPVGDAYGIDMVVDEQRSEEHTSELQSLMRNSYAVFCLKKKKTQSNEEQIIK